ncbi:MAG: RNA polymerase factor sigma-54 [Alphaproteobacteria bacterium]|nr:RNA polymerase factor sigma-54 [Alphaproteobacteria bacterium]
MALAPRLELRQSQQLVMTPQLQQAIKLLQLSNLELAEFVEQQLEENPFLERPEERADDRPAGQADAAPNGQEVSSADAEPKDADGIDLSSEDAHARAEEAIDAAFDDDGRASADGDDGGYAVNEWASVGGGRGFDDDREFGETHVSDITLKEHLTNQLQVATSDPQSLFVGAYIIDLVDDAGYLREAVDDIALRLGADRATVEDTLRLIQTFDPSGVGARDLQECLRLQLIDRDRLDPAMASFIDNLEMLAKGDLKGLMRATRADEDDVRDMIAEVRALNPKPGYAYGSDPVQVVAPDVFVRKAADGGWRVELNNDTLPKILVNQHYYAEVSKNKAKDKDASYLHEQFANASWLAKSLDQRARTILKVAEEIVRQQDAFLAYGVKHLRPLNLRAVADAIEMHESTVSRVTSNKYVATPRGVFELKYFFTASIASNNGGDAYSAEAVRHRIKEFIAAETPETILSDDKLVELLGAEGIDIARRTVAKYRETLGIPSSVQRRRDAVRSAI